MNDFLNQNSPLVEPEVFIARQSFWHWAKNHKILLTGMILITVVGIFGSLIYFKSIDAPNLKPVSISAIPKELNLKCPVESKYCSSEQVLNASGGSVFGYRADAGSTVTNSTKTLNLDHIAIIDDKKSNQKYFYISTIDGDNCYTVKYTFPADAIFEDVLSIPFGNTGKIIATLGSKLLNINSQEVNVILQVLNSPIDPVTQCNLAKKSPEFFK